MEGSHGKNSARLKVNFPQHFIRVKRGLRVGEALRKLLFVSFYWVQ